MGQEEQIQRRTSNIGIIRSSKKLQKQKRVPQRGLGVAQLEKIRLEEQQKIDFKSSPSPPNNSFSISSNSTIPCPSDISSLNIDIYNVHQANKISDLSFEFNLGKDNCGVVDPGLAFRLAAESNPIWPLHSFIQRSPPPSMMNVSSRSSSSSSSLLNLQTELPSNQNNSYTVPLWAEEEKMVGMKRSYPFALDNPTALSFHCKLPTIIHPFGRSEESPSFPVNGGTTFNPNFRGPSSCESISNWKKNKKENGDFNGDFLTLGPPNSKMQRPSSHLLPFHNSHTFDFSSLPYQGIIEDETIEAAAGGASVGNELQPFYSFLPPPIMQIAQPTTITTCDFGENVIDLNLRL